MTWHRERAASSALAVPRPSSPAGRWGRLLVLVAGDRSALTRAPALSHYEGRSGDLKMLGRAYWITSSSTTTHGTGHRYDTRVPLMLYGFGIKKGEFLEPCTPIDLAPTLAFLTGVTLPDALGRVLADDVVAAIDAPPFDRSNVDGFALRAADTRGATDAAPHMFALNAEVTS